MLSHAHVKNSIPQSTFRTTMAMTTLANDGTDHDSMIMTEQPKRPLSAYNYFFKSERARMLGIDENADEISQGGDRRNRKVHGKISFRDMAHQVGTKWKALSDEDRAPYIKLFEEDRARYKSHMKVWNERHKKRVAMEAQQQKRAKLDSSSRSSYLLLPDAAVSSIYDSTLGEDNKHGSELYDITADLGSPPSEDKADEAIDQAIDILNDEDFQLFDIPDSSAGSKRKRSAHPDLVDNELLDNELKDFLSTGIDVAEESPIHAEHDFDKFLEEFDCVSDDEAPPDNTMEQSPCKRPPLYVPPLPTQTAPLVEDHFKLRSSPRMMRGVTPSNDYTDFLQQQQQQLLAQQQLLQEQQLFLQQQNTPQDLTEQIKQSAFMMMQLQRQHQALRAAMSKTHSQGSRVQSQLMHSMMPFAESRPTPPLTQDMKDSTESIASLDGRLRQASPQSDSFASSMDRFYFA